MRKIFTTTTLIAFLALLGHSSFVLAQQARFQAKNGMTATPRNYKTFAPVYKDAGKEITDNNKGYENHPEIGMLFAETPCDNCYELIGKRTEKTKTYVKKGSETSDGGKDIYQQTSTHSMHYKDAAGNWRTIKTQLQPGKAGVYSATEQPVPVTVNTANRYTSIGKAGENFTFNNNLELVYAKPDGSEVSLGTANWGNYTAGDDGVYVTNAWPGVDIEIYAIRGATKTNFYINHAMPAYADGKLLVRDHLKMDKGMFVYGDGHQKYKGNLSVRNASGTLYDISVATAFEQKNTKATLEYLEYFINGNNLDIALPGSFLNRDASAYPVVIDPLVSTATTSTVTGSTFSTNWTVPCVYANAATVPANCTVTDIQWTFNYITTGGAWLDEGSVDFRLGTCRSPTGTTGIGGFYWFCNLIGSGTCTGSNISLFADVSSCVPAPQCTSYDLNMTMDFYQDYLTTAPCATTYVSGAIPLTITVIGHTVESNGAVTVGASTICAGASTTLSTSAHYGVAPYTYSWTPGGGTGSPVTVSPTATTTYTATVTDACGITSTATTTVTVNPVPPITGTLAVCVGGTTALSDATTGGTWTSSTLSVATVGSSSGIVSGVSAGTSTITYTTPAGCTTTATVTVNLLSPISGNTTICAGATSTLSDALAGGVWTSSNSGIASVDPATGVVTGIAQGTVTITYTAGSGCSTTISFTVNPIPAGIGGPSVICVGTAITLTDATTPGVWSSSNSGIATINAGTGVGGGASAGSATITYTLPSSCYIIKPITVNATYNNSITVTICTGASYTFGGTSYSTTGVYPHVFTTINGCDSLVALHLNVTPVTHVNIYDSVCLGSSFFFGGSSYSTTGSYDHTFANVSGCDSIVTLNLFIKPIPGAPSVTDISICQNDAPVLPLTASGAHLLWYTNSTTGVGNPAAPVPTSSTAATTTWYVSQTVNGCESPRSAINVVVHNKPAFTITPGKPYECQRDTISFTYNGPAFPGLTFLWSVPGHAIITGGTTASDSTIIARFDTSIGNNLVYLTISDGYTPCNSTVSFPAPVFLDAPPAYFTHHPNVCAGDSILIALTTITTGINSFLWNFDGGNVVVASSNQGGPYKVVWNTPGIYVVTLNAVTNPHCPASTVKDTIHVQPYPDARIAPFTVVGGKSVPCAGDSIIFSPLNFDDRYNYHWSPDHFFTQDNASKQYGVIDFAGYVKLNVTTPYGCDATDSILVNAQPCCIISFPTAFTPNGDGKNDVFRPITVGNHKIQYFRIANRWGQNVYESLEDGAAAWDGTFNGVKQDMGVYYYFISYDCAGTKTIEKGEVTLVR